MSAGVQTTLVDRPRSSEVHAAEMNNSRMSRHGVDRPRARSLIERTNVGVGARLRAMGLPTRRAVARPRV
eukprot:scaffold656_cov403-Pavlova_lutheri.AAC.2